MLLLLLKDIKHTGWTAVQLNKGMDYDLENSPLQIRTNSEVGSNEEVKVHFYTSAGAGDPAGGIEFSFKSSLQYSFVHCTNMVPINFPTDLPTEMDKVWTIFLTRNSGEIRVVVICNDKEVLNVVLSDTTCTFSSWNTYWSKDVEKIAFLYSHHSASDFYRPGKQLMCFTMLCIL